MSSPVSAGLVAHGLEPPSAWVQRWSHLLAARGTVLDIACGHGRHMRWFASRGHPVTGVDRSTDAIAAVGALGEAVVADIENGPWPLMQAGQVQQFDAVVVTNYLWRALFPVILQSLAPGGVLLYETFADGNETVGKPSRADFLLNSGELLRVFGDLHIVAFEDGFMARPERFVQRIAAVNKVPGLSTNGKPARYPLQDLPVPSEWA
jgi:SAM-dependent methyltransferase